MSLDFNAVFHAAPAAMLVLSPNADFTMLGVTDAYLSATMTCRDDIVGHPLFTVFPDNPDDPTATGTRNLRASLERVRAARTTHTMAVQRYDIPRCRSVVGDFEERHWAPTNEPVFDSQGELVYIVHHVRDVTSAVRAPTRRLRIESSHDVAMLREAIRSTADDCALDTGAVMDLVVAASELGSNMIVHAGGGIVELEEIRARPSGLRLRFHDDGPGVGDVERALRGGHSTAGTLGRGLSGARNLVDEFDMETSPRGTTISVAKWRR